MIAGKGCGIGGWTGRSDTEDQGEEGVAGVRMDI
jgi:hypothetical protein